MGREFRSTPEQQSDYILTSLKDVVSPKFSDTVELEPDLSKFHSNLSEHCGLEEEHVDVADQPEISLVNRIQQLYQAENLETCSTLPGTQTEQDDIDKG